MDDVDGEVARASNKQSLEGLHFEFLQEYIHRACLGIGLGIGLFRLYDNDIYLYLGFLLTFVFTIRFAITSLLKSILRKGVIDKKINTSVLDADIQRRLDEKFKKSHSWSDRNIFLKIFGIYPSGLLFSIEFFSPILLILIIIEYLLSIYINFPLTQIVIVLPIYLFIVGMVRLIDVVGFISKLEKDRPITSFLNELSE